MSTPNARPQLLLALALFVALSFYGDSLERWHIKTGSFARVLIGDTTHRQRTPSSATDRTRAIRQAPGQDFSQTVDTARKSILFIGDSMLDGLGPRLAAYAEENGHTLVNVIWYSSTTEVWGRTEKLKEYIAEYQPDYIFVSLGGNELFVSNIRQNERHCMLKN